MPTPLARVLSDRALTHESYNPLYNPLKSRPILVHQRNAYDGKVFSERPFWSALLFDNNDSDARDHCAAERTFLSWLRLATYMSIVAVAILISFHLNDEPTATERHVALPFGVLFWLLGCSCLAAGLHNYIKTVNGYATRRALVQSGIGTQVVFTIVASAIIAACVLFLSTNATTR